MIRMCALAVVVLAVASCKSKAEIEFQQYYVQGEQLYQAHCSNCHQNDGTGLGALYPPIAKSDYMERNFPEVICLIRNGKSTPVEVNGVTYTQPMPGVSSLTDIDVAKLATYIYNTWEHKRGIVTVKEVAAATAGCPGE